MKVDENTPPAQLAKVLAKLKAHKKSCDEEYKQSMKRTNEAIEKLEAQILDRFEREGLSSIKVPGVGTVYRKTQWSISVQDPEAYGAYLEEFGYDTADVRANKTVIRKMIEEDGEAPPPGLKITMMNTLNINATGK